MSVQPYPAGHYRLGYVRQSLEQLRETLQVIENGQQGMSALVDASIVRELIRRREARS